MNSKFIFYFRIVPAVIAGLIAFFSEQAYNRYSIWFLLIAIAALLLPTLFKHEPTANEAKQLHLSEGLVVIAVYLSVGKLQPLLLEEKDPWFYGMMFLELALTFYGIRKFRSPQQEYLLLTKVFGLITLLWLVYIAISGMDQFFWLVVVIACLAYTDHFLCIYWAPVYKTSIRYCGDAWKLRKEFKKLYRIK